MRKLKVITILFFVTPIIFSCSRTDDKNTIIITEGTIEWEKTYGGTNDDVAQAIIESNDGGYAIIGYTNSIDGDIANRTVEENDFWVLKLNEDGSLDWKETYGGSGDDQGRAIIQTLDGGYVITGPSKSADGDGTGNQGQHDFWILKLSSSGNVEWEKSYGYSGHDHSQSILQTNDGGYLVGGYLDIDASGGLGNKILDVKHGVGEFWVLKLDAFGSLEWQKYFGGSSNDRIYKVLQASDGNFLLIGSSESADFDIKNSKGSYDFWVVKIDQYGEMMWEKSFGGSGIDNGYSATTTNDGNYLIAGSAISNDGNVSNNMGNSDIWIVKIDDDGNLIWERSYGGSGFDAAWSVSNNEVDDTYIIAGNSKSVDGNVSGNNGENDFLVLKITTSGKLVFTKSLGGSGLDFAYGAIQSSDGKIVVVGETESTDIDITENKGGKDIWVVKLY